MSANSETIIMGDVDCVNTKPLAGPDGPPEQDGGYFESLLRGTGAVAVAPASKPAEAKSIAPKYPLRAFDAADVCRQAVVPPKYLIDKFLPFGTIDWFSPPECAKTTTLMSIVDAVANSRGTWMGRVCAAGRVLYIGGEKSDDEVWRRDFARLGLNFPDKDRFQIIDPYTYIWEWDRKNEVWEYSQEARETIMPFVRDFKPTLVITDTLARYAKGSDPGNLTQQVELGRILEKSKKDFCSDVFLTVSHTPQCTDKETLYNRLHYTARAGGNGLPGMLRYMLAMTELRSEERTNAGILDSRNRVIALAAAKHSELPAPQPTGSKMNPILIELKRDGSIELIPGDKNGEYAVKGNRGGDEGETQEKLRKENWAKRDAKNEQKTPKAADWLDILEAGVAAIRASGIKMEQESKRADDGLPCWSLSQKQQALEAGRVALGLSAEELQRALSPVAGSSDNYDLPFPGTPAPPTKGGTTRVRRSY